MATTQVKLPDLNEVSRQAYPLQLVRSERGRMVDGNFVPDPAGLPHDWYETDVFSKLGIQTEETSLDLNDKAGKTLKVIHFPKPKFEVLNPDKDGKKDTPDECFARIVAFLETSFPQLLKDGKVIRLNNPLLILGAHLTYSLDLTVRNALRSKESALAEGPDKAILKAAEKLALHKGISIEAALERVKAMWAD